MKTNEEIASEINNVIEYAELSGAVRVEDGVTPELAVVVFCNWNTADMSFGAERYRAVVDRAFMYGNTMRLPDACTMSQLNHAIAVSHPDVKGLSSKQTIRE